LARTSLSRLAASSTASVDDYNELPRDFPRRNDVLVALKAVRKACQITNGLQPGTAKEGISTVEKSDASPVTVGDFACQASVLHDLHMAFPEDSFIAEESSSALDDDDELAKQILVATALSDIQQVKQSVDLGKDYLHWEERGKRPPRVWCLDPIDGTRGFLRGKRQGGQYCVALALLEDGVPTIGILGCPNLPVSPSDFNYAWGDDETEDNNTNTRGCLFVASRGGGCFQLPLTPGSPSIRVTVTPNDESTVKVGAARFCIGVEKYSDALGQCAGMAKVIHGDAALDDKGEIKLARRIDSQAKHGVLARAGAEFYVRLPKPGYVEWIWDHAAGNVVVEEAGGEMTDVDGNPIDFSLGPQLSPNVAGVLASNGGIFHSALVEAYRVQESSHFAGSAASSSNEQ
jgi:HAL2 family 3'(2'),5'-bisphosphate nucleotidase